MWKIGLGGGSVVAGGAAFLGFHIKLLLEFQAEILGGFDAQLRIVGDVGLRVVVEVVHFFERAEVFFGGAVALEAPAHRVALVLIDHFHFVHIAVAALAGVESLRILSKLTKPIFRSCCACAESGTSKDSSKASPSLVVFLVTDFNSISAMLNKYVNKPGPKRVKSSIYAKRTSIMPLEHQNPVPNWNWNRCVRSNDCGFIGYPSDILSGPTGEIQLKPKPVL